MSRGNIQLFIDLPTSLSCAVLSNWLALKYVCRLDSALCERSKRAALLSLLQSVEFVGQLGCLRNEQLIWLNSRFIRTTELVVTAALSFDLLEEYLQRCGRHVLSVRLSEPSDVKLLHLVSQHCQNIICYRAAFNHSTYNQQYGYAVLRANPNLKELTATYFGTKPAQLTQPRQPAEALLAGVALPKLKYLAIWGAGFDDGSCVALLERTNQLCYLAFHSTSVTSSGLLEAVRFCPQLRFLRPPDLFDIDQALSEVTNICIHLQHVDLSRCASLGDAGIIAIARNVRGLRSIHFKYSQHITSACLHHLAAHQHESLELFSFVDYDFLVEAAPPPDVLQPFSMEAVVAFRSQCNVLRSFCWQMKLPWLHERATTTPNCVTILSLLFVNDVILSAIAARCKQLEVLIVSKCSTLDQCSDTILVKVVEGCSSLHSVASNNHLQVARLQHLYSAYPHIKVSSIDTFADLYSMQSLYRQEHPLDE